MRATMDGRELHAAADAILLQTVEDSRPEHKIYRQPLSKDRAQWFCKTSSFCLDCCKGIVCPQMLDGHSKENADDKLQTPASRRDFRKVHLKTKAHPKAAPSSALSKPICNTHCAERGLYLCEGLVGPKGHFDSYTLPWGGGKGVAGGC